MPQSLSTIKELIQKGVWGGILNQLESSPHTNPKYHQNHAKSLIGPSSKSSTSKTPNLGREKQRNKRQGALNAIFIDL